MNWWQQLADQEIAFIACAGGLLGAWTLLVVTDAWIANNQKSGNSRQKSDNRSGEQAGSRRAA